MLPILYRDSTLVAIAKPAGMPVHRSREHADAGAVVLQALRDQLGCHVYPVHRLDRPTSGVLVLALSSGGARSLQERLAAPAAEKWYLALVRGRFPQEPFTLERPLTKRPSGVVQEARTDFEWVRHVDLGGGFGVGSLVRARIHTGRRHQIRRHLGHLRHHVLVDTTHGKGAINRHAREVLGIPRLFLHAERLRLGHPRTGEPLEIVAPLPDDLAVPLGRLPTARGE